MDRRTFVAALPLFAARPRLHGAEMMQMSAVAAIEAMKRGEITAEAYAQTALAGAQAWKVLNAFIALDEAKVLEHAHAADKARAKGTKLGSMHGLPIPVKDSVNTLDYPTTAGTAALRGFTPKADAPAVARLKAAGGYVLGKTNLHELSFGWTSNNSAFGAVHNPYDLTRIPGGSTGGTAAVVAAHIAPLGVAEDTQGSVRVPAALCGICAFRPTTGRYPTAGTAPITPVFDQIGSHARAVADLVLFDQVMTGEAAQIRPAALKGLRIGVARDANFEGVDAEVARIADAVIARLKAAGAVVVEAPLPGLTALVGQITRPVQVHDAGPAIRAWLTAGGAAVDLEAVTAGIASPDVKALFERSIVRGAPSPIPDAVYAEAVNVKRPALQRMLADWFKANGVEAMLFPATMTTAAKIGDTRPITVNGKPLSFTTAVSRNISAGSTAGLPGLILPGGLTPEGMPLGLELDGPAGSDRRMLAIGLAIQALLDPMPAPRLT